MARADAADYARLMPDDVMLSMPRHYADAAIDDSCLRRHIFDADTLIFSPPMPLPCFIADAFDAEMLMMLSPFRHFFRYFRLLAMPPPFIFAPPKMPPLCY